MTSGQDVSEYLDTLGLVKSYFFREKNEKKSKKIYLGAPTPPEDEAICLFAGLLANPDMPLSLRQKTVRFMMTNRVTNSSFGTGGEESDNF